MATVLAELSNAGTMTARVGRATSCGTQRRSNEAAVAHLGHVGRTGGEGMKSTSYAASGERRCWGVSTGMQKLSGNASSRVQRGVRLVSLVWWWWRSAHHYKDQVERGRTDSDIAQKVERKAVAWGPKVTEAEYDWDTEPLSCMQSRGCGDGKQTGHAGCTRPGAHHRMLSQPQPAVALATPNHMPATCTVDPRRRKV